MNESQTLMRNFGFGGPFAEPINHGMRLGAPVQGSNMTASLFIDDL